MLAVGNLPGVRVWRNNTGALRDATGQLIRFGLKGSADILGIVGPAGRFLAIEVKAPRGRLSEHQQNFRAMVESLGGLYVVARSPGEALDAIAAARESVPAGRRS